MYKIFIKSINSILALFGQRSGDYFSFSLLFFIISMVAAGILSFAVCIIGDKLFQISPYYDSFWDALWMDSILLTRWARYSEALVIFSLGLYAVYLHSILFEDKREPGIKNFFVSVSPEVWHRLCYVLIIYTAVHIIFFLDIINIDNSDLIGHLEAMSGIVSFYTWVNAMAELLKTILPYIGSVYILLSITGEKLKVKIVKKYFSVFCVVFLLAFILKVVSLHFVSNINFYLFGLLEIPFKNSISILVLKMGFYLFVTGYFYLLMASSFLFPFLHAREKEPMEGLII